MQNKTPIQPPEQSMTDTQKEQFKFNKNVVRSNKINLVDIQKKKFVPLLKTNFKFTSPEESHIFSGLKDIPNSQLIQNLGSYLNLQKSEYNKYKQGLFHHIKNTKTDEHRFMKLQMTGGRPQHDEQFSHNLRPKETFNKFEYIPQSSRYYAKEQYNEQRLEDVRANKNRSSDSMHQIQNQLYKSYTCNHSKLFDEFGVYQYPDNVISTNKNNDANRNSTINNTPRKIHNPSNYYDSSQKLVNISKSMRPPSGSLHYNNNSGLNNTGINSCRNTQLGKNSFQTFGKNQIWSPTYSHKNFFNDINIDKENFTIKNKGKDILKPFVIHKSTNQYFQSFNSLDTPMKNQNQKSKLEIKFKNKDFKSLKCDDFDYMPQYD